nr:PREDICTED: uncharacterized protein LOC102365388 [Latimeria chalumnae]|eukprot:XP_006013217.1 PREDICTED: uncharacterized protein LOC102365388 [Latimeria chalumnae]
MKRLHRHGQSRTQGRPASMDFLYLPDPAENGAAGNLSASQERELPRIPHRGAAREPSENDHTYSELERPFIRTKFKEDRLYESVAIRDGAKAAGLLDTSELWRSKEGGVGADQKLAPPWQGGGTVTDEYASIRKVKRKKEKDRDEASQPESPEAQQEEVCQGASTQHNICRESSSDILVGIQIPCKTNLFKEAYNLGQWKTVENCNKISERF